MLNDGTWKFKNNECGHCGKDLTDVQPSVMNMLTGISRRGYCPGCYWPEEAVKKPEPELEPTEPTEPEPTAEPEPPPEE